MADPQYTSSHERRRWLDQQRHVGVNPFAPGLMPGTGLARDFPVDLSGWRGGT